MKFLFQKVFIGRVYQYTSGSNAVVFEKAVFVLTERNERFPWAGLSEVYAVGRGRDPLRSHAVTHVRQLVPCLVPGSAGGLGISGDLR